MQNAECKMRNGRQKLHFALYVFHFAFCILCLLKPLPCSARVSVEGRVNRTAITVGDSVVYTLTVQRGDRDRVVFPDVAAQLGDLEVRDARKPEVKKTEAGVVEEAVEFVLTSYAVGAHEIPAFPVGYATASGDTGSVSANPVRITVRSVIRPGEEKALKDVKPPVDLPVGLPWWAWLLIVLTLAGALAWFLHRRWKRKPRAKAGPQAPPRPIDELEEFDKIAALGLLARGDYKQHYSLVSDAMRRYVERRYRIEAMERTTYEIVFEMRQAPLERPTIARFEEFLSDCDLVKFAKHVPPIEEMARLIDRAKDIVRFTMLLPERLETAV